MKMKNKTSWSFSAALADVDLERIFREARPYGVAIRVVLDGETEGPLTLTTAGAARKAGLLDQARVYSGAPLARGVDDDETIVYADGGIHVEAGNMVVLFGDFTAQLVDRIVVNVEVF